MAKNIIITNKQYKKLLEATEDEWSYVTDSDVKYNGLSAISADGVEEEGEEYGEPFTGHPWPISPQTYYSKFRYGIASPTLIRETEMTNKEDNTADDFAETDAFDDNRLEDPRRVQIPNTVQQREKMLIDAINNANLNDVQKTVVLNNLIPKLTSDSTTYHSQKRTDREIQKSKLNVPNAMKKNVANNA